MSHVTDNIALSAESILTKMLDNDLIRDETSKAYTIEELSNMAVRAARVIHGLPADGPTIRPGFISVTDLEVLLARNTGTIITKHELRLVIDENRLEWNNDPDSP